MRFLFNVLNICSETSLGALFSGSTRLSDVFILLAALSPNGQIEAAKYSWDSPAVSSNKGTHLIKYKTRKSI